MIPVKARVHEPSSDEYEVIVFVNGLWRIFGTPCPASTGLVKAFKGKPSAKRSAERMALALGIKLDWEVK